MAESETGQEKTEEPTPKRLSKSREEGQVARSRELGTTVVLLVSVGGLIVFGPVYGNAAKSIMQYNFTIPREVMYDTNLLLQHFSNTIGTALESLYPLFALIVIAAIAGSIALSGWVFSSKMLMPKYERIDPIKGLGRMFSMNSLVELFKALAKFALVTSAAILILVFFQSNLRALAMENIESAIYDGFYIVVWSVLGLSSTMILVSLVDVPYQIYDNTKKLKMTLQEVKDEMKETEGKPEVKSKVRQLQREMAQRRMLEAVPEADVVITNPEHFSVALKYDPEGTGAPTVVAKGVDYMAIKIREVANANDVMIIPLPPLCRSIYFTTEIDQEIPAKLYLAVAQVLAYVFQLRAHKENRERKPKPLDDIIVPLDAQYDSEGRPMNQA